MDTRSGSRTSRGTGRVAKKTQPSASALRDVTNALLAVQAKGGLARARVEDAVRKVPCTQRRASHGRASPTPSLQRTATPDTRRPRQKRPASVPASPLARHRSGSTDSVVGRVRQQQHDGRLALERLQAELAELRGEVDALRTAKAAAVRSKLRAESSLAQLQGQHAELAQQHSASEDSLRQLRNEAEELRAAERDKDAEIQRLSSSVQRLSSELQSAQAAVSSLRTDCEQAAAQERSASDDAAAEAARRLLEYDGRLADLTRLHDSSERKKQQLKRDNELLLRERDRLENAVAVLRRALEARAGVHLDVVTQDDVCEGRLKECTAAAELHVRLCAERLLQEEAAARLELVQEQVCASVAAFTVHFHQAWTEAEGRAEGAERRAVNAEDQRQRLQAAVDLLKAEKLDPLQRAVQHLAAQTQQLGGDSSALYALSDDLDLA